jgi:hypothetical protein
LETNTPEADRAIEWETNATGNAYGGIENDGGGWGMDAVDPKGLTVLVAGVAVLP